MARPSNFINVEWGLELAYAVGLITTDGNLSPDGRHINFTSKDESLCLLFKKCLGLENVIGKKARGGEHNKKYFVVQFGSLQFYKFLLSIGLTPAKSKTVGPLLIPDAFFSDFLRGCIDGDGNISETKHPESQHIQLRLRLCSASEDFLIWILAQSKRLYGTAGGWISTPVTKSIYMLNFGKADSVQILKAIYPHSCIYALNRKMRIAHRHTGRVAELV